MFNGILSSGVDKDTYGKVTKTQETTTQKKAKRSAKTNTTVRSDVDQDTYGKVTKCHT